MPGWFTEVRGSVPALPRLLLGLLPIVLILGAWGWATSGATVEDRWINPQVLPSPGEVLGKVSEVATRRERVSDVVDGEVRVHEVNSLLANTWASVRRVGLGFLLALSIPLPVGIAAGAFASVRAMASPLITVAGYIPIAAMVPLTMSWFGIGEAQKVLFLAMAFAIFLLPQVLKAVDGVDEVYLSTARTLGANRRQLVFRVLVPIAAPDLWHAMRLAFGVGWTYIVLTEAMVLSDGLGYMIAIAQRRGPREQIYLTIILITAIAWLADLTMARLGERFFPYRVKARR